MRSWNERPREIKNLFNPAFCSLLLLKAIQGYEEKNQEGIPFSLLLLILPLCLYKQSREVFIKNSRSYFLKIIEKKPQLLIGFADRVHNLLPYTFEALGFSMHINGFTITENGRFILQPKSIKKAYVKGTKEFIEIQKVAQMLGRKFSQNMDAVTIYTAFGVRP